MNVQRRHLFTAAACLLLALMAVLAGGAALRESITLDEVAHIGAGVSYLQTFDLRLNPEHPPLAKMLAAVPLVLRGTHADYSNPSWTVGESFFPAYLGEWVFGHQLATKWNDPVSTLAWARLPMLLLTLALGWAIFCCARRLGGDWAGLLCLAVYVSTPAFLAFGPLVHTDIAVTLFSLLTLWTFAELWQNPVRRNVSLFALAFAAALLSKFTAGILLFAFGAFALSTRWRAVPEQPTTKPEVGAWRRIRWRATLRGILWAALVVYAFYFIFSVRQSTDALDRLGHGAAIAPLQRLLMPIWLYVRGVLFVFATASRPTFILGRAYPHGVWFYFPIVFALKSPIAFLGLLAIVATCAAMRKRRASALQCAIPSEVGMHWRVIWTALLVFTGFCLLSRLDISIRHFSVPLVLLILMLAPLPRMIGPLGARESEVRTNSSTLPRVLAALTTALVAGCLFTAWRAFPFYFPYVSALGFGRPAYTLMSDSNVDWNQSLPEVKRFADRRGISQIDLDDYSLGDGSAFVPQSELWDCQQPTAQDGGKWAVISANMILDGHNCEWLMRYPHEALAAGSMYAIRLPDSIPPAGSVDGPPLPASYHQFIGTTSDIRLLFLEFNHHPEKLPRTNEEMQSFATAFSSSQATSPPAPAK